MNIITCGRAVGSFLHNVTLVRPPRAAAVIKITHVCPDVYAIAHRHATPYSFWSDRTPPCTLNRASTSSSTRKVMGYFLTGHTTLAFPICSLSRYGHGFLDSLHKSSSI